VIGLEILIQIIILILDSLSIKEDIFEMPVDDASYCTTMPISVEKDILVKLAKYILNLVEDDVKREISIKKYCERLSWIDEGQVEPPE